MYKEKGEDKSMEETRREGDEVCVENGAFLDVKPCGSCKNRRFGGN
jgi:hypothetical protein